MSEKTFNTRIQQKHDTEANWLKAVNFIPKAGELIVYDADDTYNYIRVKVGDGVTNVNLLSFVTDGLEKQIYRQIDEPIEAAVGALWLDLDDEGQELPLDSTLTQEGIAADAKAVGDAIAQKTQVQIITWGEND